MLVAVTVFAAIDRQILTIAIEPIRLAFKLSDIQIGLMQGLGLTLVGAFAGVPLAWLADRFDRRLVLALCILAWSAATAARGFAQDFNHLLLGTIGLAIAEAGLGPIVFSMIPSMFAGAQRAKANLIYFAAALIGAALGMGLAGLGFKMISASAGSLPDWAQGMEPWRLAFLAAALPGAVLAAVVMLIRAEHGRPLPRAAKARQSDDGPVHRAPEFLPYLRAHWRTLLALFCAAGSASAAFAPISAWLAPAMGRRFGMDPGDVGVSLGAVYGAGALAGIVLAGIAARLWARRYPGILGLQIGQYLAAVSTLAAALLGVAQTPFMVYAATGIMMAAAMAFFALLPGLWQEVAPAGLRTRMIAVAGVVTTTCTAAGPVVVGYLSGALGDRPDGLLIAVALASAPCMLLAVVLMRASIEPSRRLLAAIKEEESALASASSASGN
nr:MFS transporter [uncultured Roseateles sp.]